MKWRFISASITGTSHAKTQQPCQDYCACQVLQTSDGTEALVAIVSDGAGSAQKSEVGSALACTLFVDEIKALFSNGGRIQDIQRPFIISWLRRFHNEVKIRAEEERLALRDYACTLLGAVIGNDYVAFVQIGDGAIVISTPEAPDEYDYVFWPQQGEYANQTFFATGDSVFDLFQHDVVRAHILEVALFTDGIQNLALDYAAQTAHMPFFRSLFTPLRIAETEKISSLSSSLQNFLNSPRVNERSDDDKTLILATRHTGNVLSPDVLPMKTSENGSDTL